MTRKELLSVRLRASCLLILIAVSAAAWDQPKKKRGKNPNSSFLDTQFWLGIKFGMNYADAVPLSGSSGFSPLDYDADKLEKNYAAFALPGGQAGLEMTLYHKSFSAGFHPVYQRSRYSFTNSLEWFGEQPSEQFATTYESEQRIDVINVPFFLKYDIIRSGQLRPFAMAGMYYSFLTGAERQVHITQTDYSFGAPQEIDAGRLSLGVKSAFKNYYGWLAGGGISYDYWNIRSVLELSYNHSLSSLTRPGVSQNELASLGDLNDELNLRQWVMSVSFVFPLRYIDKQFQAY